MLTMAQHRFGNIRHRRTRGLRLSRSVRLFAGFIGNLVSSRSSLMRRCLCPLFSFVGFFVPLDTLIVSNQHEAGSSAEIAHRVWLATCSPVSSTIIG